MGTFRLVVLEKHVRFMIWEEAIKDVESSNKIHGLNLSYIPPSSATNVEGAGTANIHAISPI